jgi:2'-5' RNA ligase
MRLFFAQRATLDDRETLQAHFSPCFKGRWRTPPSLHATALFLGDGYDPVEAIEKASALAIEPEDVPLDGFGRFERNRIFYARAEHPTLEKAYRRLCDAFGLPQSRIFIPHVTLMRYKEMSPDCLRQAESSWRHIPFGQLHGPLELMKSTLLPTGAVYETLHTFK